MKIEDHGFASMDISKQREIASKGGKAAHKEGADGHEWTLEEAREAGHKGAVAGHERGTSHVFTPEDHRKAVQAGTKARLKKKLRNKKRLY